MTEEQRYKHAKTCPRRAQNITCADCVYIGKYASLEEFLGAKPKAGDGMDRVQKDIAWQELKRVQKRVAQLEEANLKLREALAIAKRQIRMLEIESKLGF